MPQPVALTIAGSDPTGGAGIQADLKSFAAHKVYGASVITALTAQNRQRFELFPLKAKIIEAQAACVFEAFDVKAIKIGLLCDKETVAAVIRVLQRHNETRAIPVVLDPVIRASSGGVALDRGGLALLRDRLIPLTTLIKPNIPEAALLLGEGAAQNLIEAEGQSVRLLALGAPFVLVSGGHLPGSDVVDILARKSGVRRFAGRRITGPDVHGTGCTLSATIAARLALDEPVETAVDASRDYLIALFNHEKQLDIEEKPVSLSHFSLYERKNTT